MKTLYHIWDDDNDQILISFLKREDAFKVLKEKSLIQTWRSFELKESQVLEEGEEITPVLYYKASCGLADEEITVKEEKYFPPFDEPPENDVKDVVISGTDLLCEGRDLEKVCTTLRKFIASKRYEYEVAVRKICNIVQPKLENGEAMTVNQICDETNVAQDIVVKVLLLLKKEGFLNIVDPLEQKGKVETAPPKKKDGGLYLPRGAKGKYQQSSGQTNVGFDSKGRLRKLKGNTPAGYTSGGGVTIPIYKKKP